MSSKLARLIELYNECERTVENIIQRLCVPGPTHPQHSALTAMTPFTAEYSISQTMPRDLFVENWIMEMMYLEGSDIR